MQKPATYSAPGEYRLGLAESFGLGGADTGLFEGGQAGRKVYEILRERIIRLDLPPGTPLPRTDLAKEFGISLTPLREALQQLGEERLVLIFPQSRTLVAPIDVAAIGEAQFLRLALETELVRQLACEIAPEDLARLRGIHALQEGLAGQADRVGTFQELDELFHRALFAAAGHEQSQRLVRSRSGHLDRLRRLVLPNDTTAGGPQHMIAVIEGHQKILDGIEARKPDEAVTALRDHLQRTMERLNEKRTAFPEYFA